MKSLRLLAAALLACAFAASTAFACDAHKSAKGASTTAATTASVTKTSGTTADVTTAAVTSTSKKSSAKHAAGCTAEMAAACTPAMKAACESNAAVAAAMGCEAKGTSATAVAANSGKPKSTAKMDDCCAMKSAKGATAAVTANSSNGMSADHCGVAKAASATMTAGMKCSAHASAVAHDCSACEDWVACEQEVRALGAKAQVVSLKNGAMIVYTTESPADVKTLQSVISKRHEKMVGALAGTSGKTLCPECKSLRGAIASGKLHREVVNVERGCMTLMTSNDREVVTKIRGLTGQPVAMR